jgi:hypothetical protein
MAIGSGKGRYVYYNDIGDGYYVVIADDRVADVTPSTGLVAYDPASPPENFKGRISPKRCRRVYAQGDLITGVQIRRQFICQRDSALYEKEGATTVSYTPEGGSAISMTSTGRRGEKITF